MVSIHIQLKSFLLREKVIEVREKKRKSDLLLLLDTGITRLLRATKSPVLREQLMGPSQVFPDWSLFTIQSSISPCLMVSPVPVVWNSLMSFPIISSRPKPRTFSAVWLHQTICNYEIGEPLPPSPSLLQPGVCCQWSGLCRCSSPGRRTSREQLAVWNRDNTVTGERKRGESSNCLNISRDFTGPLNIIDYQI